MVKRQCKMNNFDQTITEIAVMKLTSRHRSEQHSNRPEKDLIFALPHFLKGTKNKLPTLNFSSRFLSNASFSTFAVYFLLCVEKITHNKKLATPPTAKELKPTHKAKTRAKKFCLLAGASLTILCILTVLFSIDCICKKNKKNTFDLVNSTFLIMRAFIMILILTTTTTVYGQVNSAPKAPTYGTPQPISPSKSYTPSTPSNYQPKNDPASKIHQQQNNNSNQAMGYSKPVTPDNVKTNFYKSPFDVNVKKEQSEIDKIMVELDQMKVRDKRINFNIPSFSSIYPETKNYYSAYDELLNMANGKSPINIGKAAFLVENAYDENKGSYEEFDKILNQIVSFCKQYMIHNGYDTTSNLAKNMMLFRFFSDSLELNGKNHFPMTYDFDDYMGYKDWRKMFVTKLLKTNSGQCHSLPLLYKALAQRLGAEAYISFSPKHTYIQFREGNKFYNLELTNGMLITEDLIFESGFIKTETIRSGIYMDTLSNQQTVAYMMQDLAQGYGIKFGNDGFVIEALNKSMEYFPNSIHGMALKANYYTGLLNQYVYEIKKQFNETPTPQQLKTKYPIVYDTFLQRNAMYNMIDNTGYEPMPAEQYEAWLKSIGEEKNRQEHLKEKEQLFNIMKIKKD